MIELLLAAQTIPAVQAAEAAPDTATRGDLTVSNGIMSAVRDESDPRKGQFLVQIENRGDQADRIVSIRTSVGTVVRTVLYHGRDASGRDARAPEGDLQIRPGLTGVRAELTDFEPVRPSTISITFERAGELTVAVGALPFVPPPPPAR